MRAVLNKYEVEIRLSLAVIVVLLLLLNFGITYIFYNGQRQVSDEIDNRILTGLQRISVSILKNHDPEITSDQKTLVIRKYDLNSLETYPIPNLNRDQFESHLAKMSAENNLFPELESSEIDRLIGGDKLLMTGDSGSDRVGLQFDTYRPGGTVLTIIHAESPVLAIFSSASKSALFLTALVLLLIVPMTIGLPRLILRPFKKMKKTAESAGRLPANIEGDEVDQIIRSYKETISQLKGQEEELTRLYAESSSKARQFEKINKYILQSISSGVIHVDMAGKVIEYNRAAGEILGYENQFVMDTHYLAAFPELDELNRIIDRGISSGQVVSRRDIEIPHPDSIQHLGIESSRIFDDTGHEIGLAMLFNDITELKRLESEVEINRRMAALGEMTAGLAHQLRNSLAAISGFSQLMKKKTSNDTALSDIAESIHNETNTSEEMVCRFLSFARPLSISQEDFNIVDILRELRSKCEDPEDSGRIVFSLKYSEYPIIVSGDRLLMKEAIGNLIDNACQAIDERGEITVSVSQYETSVNILIVDTGCGIDESVKKDLFTPFVSSRPSGTGLGLALTHKILSLHKGAISFDRRTEGGTVCRITIPVPVNRVPVPGQTKETEVPKKG